MRQTSIRRFLILTSSRLNAANTSKPIESSAVDANINTKSAAAVLKPEAKRTLSQIEQMYMNKIKERNDERYLKEKKVKLHYRVTGSLLVLFVLSVYFYTMFAIRQEKFLDDFDVPEPPDQAVKTFKK
jgi:hypothetical protein